MSAVYLDGTEARVGDVVRFHRFGSPSRVVVAVYQEPPRIDVRTDRVVRYFVFPGRYRLVRRAP